MIKKQVRLTEKSRMCLKIEAVKRGVDMNAVAVGIIKDPKSWDIEFKHERFQQKTNNSYILSYTKEFRKDFMLRAAEVNEGIVGNRVTDEMIMSQLIDKYYEQRGYNV